MNRPTWSSIFPIALVLAVATYGLWVLRGDSDSAGQPAAPISASGQTYGSLADLADAADLVVDGTIVAVDDGRIITDPADPTAGFSTALFQLDVAHVLIGAPTDTVTIEQEAALLDGTRIEVNGLTANRVGDSGIWFLVRGSDDVPYMAIVNEQGRLLVDGAGSITSALLDRPTSIAAVRQRLTTR
jgi:hypothetical protein